MVSQNAAINIEVVLVQLLNSVSDLLMKEFLSTAQYRVVDHLTGKRMSEDIPGSREDPTFVEKLRVLENREMGKQLLFRKLCNSS